ncbi:MAG: transporter permease [Acidimicrobiaceae bacterium]|nr:transporter permease [Acidimicrobiaceae bacterium]
MRGGVAKIFASKILQLVLVLLAISAITFFLLSALPGNAALYRIGPLPSYTPAERAALIARLSEQLGLNKPLVVQYWIWLTHAVRGDFGLTTQGEKVTQLIGSSLWASVELAIVGLVPSIVASFLLALWAFRTRLRRAQAVVQGVMSTLFVIPSFWVGFLLVYLLAVKVTAFPASGFVPLAQSASGNLSHLVLPGLTLALPLTALFFRYLLAGLEEAEMGAYVVAARAKGISERAVAYRHVLPNGMLPTITIIGLATGSLLSSLVVVESVFSWPGLGSLLVQSVTQRDFNTLVAIVLLTAAVFVFTSIVVDLIYWFADPRTRRPGEV